MKLISTWPTGGVNEADLGADATLEQAQERADQYPYRLAISQEIRGVGVFAFRACAIFPHFKCWTDWSVKKD